MFCLNAILPVLLGGLLFASISASAQEVPLDLSNLYEDPIAIVQEFSWKETAWITGSITVIWGLSLLHDNFRYWVREKYQEEGSNRLISTLNFVGEGYIFAIPVALYGVGAVQDNTRLENAAFTSIEAGLFANGIGKVVKFVVGRKRPIHDNPDQSDRGDDFSPFSTEPNDSFPSGHATIAFALITPWVVYYPGWASYSLLLIGAGVGISRLAVDAHWSTDILGGALLGLGVGYTLASIHIRKSINVVPIVGNGVGGALVQGSF
jgi:hypothetical protein